VISRGLNDGGDEIEGDFDGGTDPPLFFHQSKEQSREEGGGSQDGEIAVLIHPDNGYGNSIMWMETHVDSVINS
jgi:hypothetical protein